MSHPGKAGKPILLAVADAPHFTTGFAQVSKNVLKVLQPDWDIHLLAINWEGNCPDHEEYPYRYYNPCPKPMGADGGDLMGYRLLPLLIKQLEPDLVLLINELSVLANRFKAVPHLETCRTLSFVSFESERFPRWYLYGAHQADKVVVFTNWAKRVLVEHETDPDKIVVIPHGHDPEKYHPLWNTLEERSALRAKIGMPDEFIAFRCDRNEYRKQWPLNIEAFSQFLKITGARDARFYAHTSYDDFEGWGFEDMIDVWGRDLPEDAIIMTDGYNSAWFGTSQTNLNELYNMADLYFSTTGGEAWGLTLHESQAAGCPVLAPANTAIPEVVHGGWLVRETHRANLIRSIEYRPPDVEPTAKLLADIYEDCQNDRLGWWKAREKALKWAENMSWEKVLQPLPEVVDSLMQKKKAAVL